VKFLAEERFTYSGFQLTSETDKEGNLKKYFYNGAGRKVREEFLRQSHGVLHTTLSVA